MFYQDHPFNILTGLKVQKFKQKCAQDKILIQLADIHGFHCKTPIVGHEDNASGGQITPYLSDTSTAPTRSNLAMEFFKVADCKLSDIHVQCIFNPLCPPIHGNAATFILTADYVFGPICRCA